MTYIDREIVVVCMPKCGTTTIRHALAEARGGWAGLPRVHCPAESVSGAVRTYGGTLPEVAEGHVGARRYLGCLRDPWSWYASVYHYARQGPPKVRCHLEAWTGTPDPSFAECVRSWTSLHKHYRRPVRADEMLWPGGEEMPSGAGLWTAAMRHYYGADLDGVDGWIRLWRLGDDLRLLGVESAGRLNRTERPRTSELYDRELAALVSEADGPVWRQARAMGGPYGLAR